MTQKGWLNLSGLQVPVCCPRGEQALHRLYPQPLPTAVVAEVFEGSRAKSAPLQTELPSERLVCKPIAQGKQAPKWCSFFSCLDPGVDPFTFRSTGDICTVLATPAVRSRHGESCSSVLPPCKNDAVCHFGSSEPQYMATLAVAC